MSYLLCSLHTDYNGCRFRTLITVLSVCKATPLQEGGYTSIMIRYSLTTLT